MSLETTFVSAIITRCYRLTAVNIAEIIYGIELLPKGKRRDDLLTAAEAMLAIESVRIRGSGIGSRGGISSFTPPRGAKRRWDRFGKILRLLSSWLLKSALQDFPRFLLH
jgi:hypothetical protein